MKKLMFILLASSGINFALAESSNESSNVEREDVGLIEAAPAGKYKINQNQQFMSNPHSLIVPLLLVVVELKFRFHHM